MHDVSITPKAASGNGDLGGYAIRCTCGESTTSSLEVLAADHAVSHVEYWTRRDGSVGTVTRADDDLLDSFGQDEIEAGPLALGIWR